MALHPGFGDGAGLNAAAAEMLLRAFLTPENIAALLNQGRVAGGPDAGGLWRMPGLGEAFQAGPLRAAMNSYFVSPQSFVVGLDSPDGRYGVHMNLAGATWRLSGVDIPDAVTGRIAREIAQRIGGSIDLHGGCPAELRRQWIALSQLSANAASGRCPLSGKLSLDGGL